MSSTALSTPVTVRMWSASRVAILVLVAAMIVVGAFVVGRVTSDRASSPANVTPISHQQFDDCRTRIPC